MRKLFAIAAMGWASLAFAGAYHVNDELKCSQCHTAHASRQHGLNSGSVDTRYPLAAQGTGHEALLTYATVNETCLACHDAYPYIIDVFGADAEGNWDRSGGALNGVVNGHTVGAARDGTAYANFMGHTLEVASPVPGDDTGRTMTLECSNCHSVHGAVSYRNLGARGALPSGATITWRLGNDNDPAFDVNIANSEDGMNYRTADVKFGIGGGATNFKGVAASPRAGMNTLCAGCHGRFHGSTGDPTTGIEDSLGAFVRHPVASPETNGVTDAAATMLIGGAQTNLTRPLWVDTAQTAFQIGCLTCHKGHGNARGYGLLYPGPMTEGTVYSGTGSAATLPGNGAIVDYENGDAAIQDPGQSYAAYPIRNLCASCHSQSRTLRK